MKIAIALSKARLLLDSKGVSSSRLDSLILLSHTFFICGIAFSKYQIIFNPDRDLSEEQQKIFFDLIERRAEREPVSHLVNKREFFGEDFFVSKDVLDPRPDSESLIELVLKAFAKTEKFRILEVGVGSGCLIITLLKAFESTSGIGVVGINSTAILVPVGLSSSENFWSHVTVESMSKGLLAFPT